ncbi:MAG: choice-of-anchor D domain-containing protein, partial [Deltaproteobacteria bacterium]|nr:choice-of-anchor D domain-containing protein [Deltaproteobacteria bacterium]
MFLNNNGSDETLIEAALENQTPGVLVLGITRSGSVGGVNASTERTILSARFKTRKEGTTSVSFRNPGLKDPGDGDISVSAWTGVTFTISESYPVISVSCTKTDFGLVNVGGESSATCTVSNIGTADLLIDSISLSNTTDFSQSNNCSAPVVSGGSCSILLTFAPKAEGLKTTTLSIVSNDSGSPYQAEFRGVGVSPPNLLMSYSILSEDFSGGMPVRWVAGGEWDIWSAGDPCSHGTLVSPFASPWAIVDPLCAGGSAPNEELFSSVFDGTSCTNATLFFTNQYSHGMDGSAGVGVSSDEGVTWTGLMRMEVNDGFPVPNTKAVDLGAGTLSESMMVKFTYSGSDGFWAIDNVLVLCNDPAALPFSSLVGGSASQIVILSNTGMGDLHVESVTRTGEDATEFSIPSSEDECTGSTVGPSGYCTFQVVFSPTSRGIKTAALSIVSDDPKSPL